MSGIGDNARDLHENASDWAKGSPIRQAHAAADKRLTELNDLSALTGSGSLLLQDPRDLAARVAGMAQMARVEDYPQTSTWESILAVALAGWCAADRFEELDVASGEAA